MQVSRPSNRVVWFDIPVADLERACAFYAAVLDIEVEKRELEGIKFAVLEHGDGIGGCLVLNKPEVSSKGPLLYLHVEGRIKDAVLQVQKKGGRIFKPIHPIGPHGFRAIALDSEGNRFALHSTTNA